jgi:hypothetical protein
LPRITFIAVDSYCGQTEPAITAVVAIIRSARLLAHSQIREAAQREPKAGVRETVGHRRPVGITLIGGAQKTATDVPGLRALIAASGQK